MKLAWLALCATLLAASDVRAQVSERHFDGPFAQVRACSFLLEARQQAEIQGRLDFAAKVESVGTDTSQALIARVWTGSPYAVRRIQFAGHRHINDTTLRRTLTTHEREMLDVQQLRRGLTRINGFNVFEPLTLDDVVVTRLDDGVTVDLTIQLRERKPRWWSVSGVLLPGGNPFKASLASRLPPWGRGVFEMATYFVSLNTFGFGRPFLAFERSLIPGQEWLSGFAVAPALSPRAMAAQYGRTHAVHSVSRLLESGVDDLLTVDIDSAQGAQPPLVCKPSKRHFWWLRAAAQQLLAFAN